MSAAAIAPHSAQRRATRATTWLLLGGSLLAAAGFSWPLFVSAVPSDAQAAVPIVAFALVPAVIVALAIGLDKEVSSAQAVALLGVLAAIGAAIRIAGAGVGGVEAVFIVLILAGRVFGARFGFLLGLLTIGVSSIVWGGFGPWTPFQAFACAWVGAGAGLLPHMPSRESTTATQLTHNRQRRLRRHGELALLVGYGIVASYAFGLVMNLWFWPFAVGPGTDISYSADATLPQNLASFGVYSLITSTLTWDTVRAITTTLGVLVAGPAVLAALRRAPLAKLRASARAASRSL